MSDRAYKSYVLGTLTLVYTLSYVDRGLMGLLLQPVKQELRLTDTQLGFLTGIAFGLFYATLGLPIARWVDRGNRVTVASVAMALWSLTVMACLGVASFGQLVLARMAAAVGEAGCMPPTYSLLGDYFASPAQRTRAMSIFMLASPLAALVSFIVGGWIYERVGWRWTFFVMGVPGLAIALLMKLTVQEPRRGENNRAVAVPPRPDILAVLRALWRQRSARHLSFAVILLFMMGQGLAPWYAAFMMRSHGMTTAELGVELGLIFGLAGAFGTVLGGYVCAKWLGASEAGQLRVSAVMTAALVPCFVLFLLLPQRRQALLAMVPLVVVFTFFMGPAFALLQRLVANSMRATSLAVVMLLANLIGMGIGPQIVGVLSDLLEPALGADSLRYAMLMVSFVAIWAAGHLWWAGRFVYRDLEDAASGETRRRSANAASSGRVYGS